MKHYKMLKNNTDLNRRVINLQLTLIMYQLLLENL